MRRLRLLNGHRDPREVLGIPGFEYTSIAGNDYACNQGLKG